MTNSLWHEVTKEEKEEIKKEAKSLLNQFSSKLEKIKSADSHFENGKGSREEGEPWKTDGFFKDLSLLNAPFTEENFIVAEKGSWKK